MAHFDAVGRSCLPPDCLSLRPYARARLRSHLLLQLTSERGPQLLDVALAYDLEEHVALLLLGLPARALLRLLQVAHVLDLLEVLDVLQELLVLPRAIC